MIIILIKNKTKIVIGSAILIIFTIITLTSIVNAPTVSTNPTILSIVNNTIISKDSNSTIQISPDRIYCVQGTPCKQIIRIDVNNEISNLHVATNFLKSLKSLKATIQEEPTYGLVPTSKTCSHVFEVGVNNATSCYFVNDNNTIADLSDDIKVYDWNNLIATTFNIPTKTIIYDVNTIISGGNKVDVSSQFLINTKDGNSINYQNIAFIAKVGKPITIELEYVPNLLDKSNKWSLIIYQGNADCIFTNLCTYIHVIDPWWDNSWTYYQPITISANADVNLHEVIKINLNSQTLVSASKMQSDCDDIRVVYQNTTVLDHNVAGCNTADTNVFFLSQNRFSNGQSNSTDYNLFYGNPAAPILTNSYPNQVCDNIDVNGYCWRIFDTFDYSQTFDNTCTTGKWCRRDDGNGTIKIVNSALSIDNVTSPTVTEGVFSRKKIGWSSGLEIITNVCNYNNPSNTQGASIQIWDKDRNGIPRDQPLGRNPAMKWHQYSTAAATTTFVRIEQVSTFDKQNNANYSACNHFDTWKLSIIDRNGFFDYNAGVMDLNINMDSNSWQMYNDANININGGHGTNADSNYADFKLRTFVTTPPTISLGTEVVNPGGSEITDYGCSCPAVGHAWGINDGSYCKLITTCVMTGNLYILNGGLRLGADISVDTNYDGNSTVGNCTGATTINSCSGININGTAQDVINAKGVTVNFGIDDNAAYATATINNLIAWINHSGAAGISGTMGVTPQNAAGTAYCTVDTNVNNVTTWDFNKIKLCNPSGGWTAAKVNDLNIVVINNDGAGSTDQYIDFLTIDVNYQIAGATTYAILSLSAGKQIIINNDQNLTLMDGTKVIIYNS